MQYSVVNYKTVKENSDFRVDADYFRPDFLNSLKLVKSHKNFALSEIGNVNGGKRLPLNEDFSDDGIPYIRAEDIKNGFVQYENSPKISLKLHEFLKRYQTKKDDVLITIVGNSIGDVGIVKFDLKKCNLTENCAKVTNLQNIIPEFLFAFLLSRHGQIQINRERVGTAQPKLALERIRKFRIPAFSHDFQNKFSKIINQANLLIDQSKSLYSQAEGLVLEELGLAEWKPEHTLSFVKNFSEAEQADRYDAEYFQPKYEKIVSAIKKYKGGFDVIKGQFKPNKKTFKKIADKEFRYIEIGCVNISDGSMEPVILHGSELPANAKIKFQKNDVIISKVRPYRGAIGIVDCDDYVGSGAFTVLQENGIINKETLMVFLRLKPLLDFSLKFNTGTSYPTITDEDILNFPLPKIDSKIQEQIKEKITEMCETKKLSKSLLEITKRGVEMAIEKNEEEAKKWIDGEVAKLEIKL